MTKVGITKQRSSQWKAINSPRQKKSSQISEVECESEDYYCPLELFPMDRFDRQFYLKVLKRLAHPFPPPSSDLAHVFASQRALDHIKVAEFQ